MSTTKFTRNGQHYDFSRCSKEQLIKYTIRSIEYSEELGQAYPDFWSNEDGPNTTAILAAARVETKADVARELAELCNKNFEPVFRNQNFDVVLTPTAADEFRALVGRYRKAVAS